MQDFKIGLALGAGAARGLAHIGVLQVLQEHDIKVDIITGTSIGAVIGGLFAAGVDLQLLARMAVELDWDDLVRLTITKLGLISSERIYQILRLLTQDRNFEDLDLPVAVVATDINNGQEVVIKQGSIAAGIRASLSIPGIFVPVEKEGRLLVDGALANRVPATVARSLGADYVIGVDLGFTEYRGKVRTVADVILRTIDILERECSSYRQNESDLLILPDLRSITPTQLNRAEEIIEKGRTAALEVLDKLSELRQETS